MARQRIHETAFERQTNQLRQAFGWLVFGLLAGASFGDFVALAFAIPPGYASFEVQTLLAYWLCGAGIGLLGGLAADLKNPVPPTARVWSLFAVLQLAYLMLIRFPLLVNVAR